MDPAFLWRGEGRLARFARGVLAPAEWAYRGVMRSRNALFDSGWLRWEAPAVPTISIGNLTVGGTGKTPVAAFVAQRLVALGAHPAIVMRGYGDDESKVHTLLTPDVPVLTSPDRVAGTRAARQAGCDVVVLDDAFQHRWVGRTEDVVLISADAWGDGEIRCLPAGPYREPLESLRRATLVLVTRKAASERVATEVECFLRRFASCPTGRVAFALDALQEVGGSGASAPVARLRGARVLAVSAIGAPAVFADQLRVVGGHVTAAAFPDHHAYSPTDVAELVHRAIDQDFVVCTLKDAVKLVALWPRAGPTLWYVSQRAIVEAGLAELDASLHRLMARSR